MDYLGLNDIIYAAKDSRFIKDPFFKGREVSLLKSGKPEVYAGGFSQVFPIKTEDGKWAFKVWHVDIDDNRERYSKIKEYLTQVSLPYFSDFEYVEGGLLVDGRLLDTLRMQWIEGLSLSEYISSHLKNPDLLKKLASKFLKMINDLHSKSISHGDLQHENIYVTNDGELKLIDYDSICVPSIEGNRDICRGRPGYQHPSRFTAGYLTSTKIDYFSELVIYISILAVSENDLLWDKYGVRQADDKLLFSYIDFLDFESSSIRRDLNLLSQEIKNLVKILDGYLAAHLNLVPFIE